MSQSHAYVPRCGPRVMGGHAVNKDASGSMLLVGCGSQFSSWAVTKMVKCYPTVSEDYLKAVEKAKKKLRGFIAEKNCAPLMLRIAWHSAGTFDVKTRTGGPFGTMKNPAELAHGANNGLDIAVRLLEPIKEQFPILSYADFYQLAGVVAVEITGGPEVPFHPGREDKPVPPPEGRLPDATKGSDHLRDVFVKQMGLSDQDIVALSGAHTLDEDAFFADYAEAHLKLSELGTDTIMKHFSLDSIADIVLPLIGITKTRNEALLGMTAEVTVTFVDVLANCIPLHRFPTCYLLHNRQLDLLMEVNHLNVFKRWHLFWRPYCCTGLPPALCGDGAKKLLDNTDDFALHGKLTTSICASEGVQACLMFSVVKAIIDALGGWNLCSGKVATNQVPLLALACKLASITHWSGEHHAYFWKLGVDRVLLNLLVNNFYKRKQPESGASLKELADAARKGLDANYLLVLRPYIWDILGWLAAHYLENFNPEAQGNSHSLNILITCGCLILMDAVQQKRQVSLEASKVEPASKAVLLMIHSPCKYIASQATYILSELSSYNVEVYLEYVLGTIDSRKFGANFSVVNKFQTVNDLIVLLCVSVLPKYRSFIIEYDGIMVLSTFTAWCLSSNANDSPSPHSTTTVANHGEVTSSQLAGSVTLGSFDVQTFIDKLQTVSSSSSNSSGLRWCATHILRFFGLYGHGVILKVRCPSLFPSVESPYISNGTICDGSSVGQDTEKPCRNFQREVRLSAQVDQNFLMKLLEFVYMGFVQVDDDIVKPLKMLARGCDFNSLSQLLSRNCPKWGTKVSCCDFTPALGPSGLHFCDMVVEAKNDEAVDWTCRYCSLSSPHMHVHKIMLWLSSDYFKALFQSGMQESHSHNIKVPVGWKALSKLIHWFYSDELPKPSLGCIWNNMDVEGQLQELHLYLELCWLAEIWLLEDFRDDALRVVVSCLSSNRYLALKIIQIATELSQWEIVEVAADCIAPSFPHLRNSGDLEFLNEELVDIIRRVHVRPFSSWLQ
ncbi:hypothetical protein IFM89_019562 [Coptis chinensis]|uniref:L-ascorbate peroxidase n=1 Tax=Coptis chinensis TaxID=261450 RepID=A0A835H3Y2_9MAGN|nr:hypothetical protein IFM89_019562 [Coptis chinensis]